MLSRSEAIRLLSAARLPALSREERASLLVGCWWTPDDDASGAARREGSAEEPIHIDRSDSGYPHLVQLEPPDDPGNSRYDELLVELLVWGYTGVTNRFLSDEL